MTGSHGELISLGNKQVSAFYLLNSTVDMVYSKFNDISGINGKLLTIKSKIIGTLFYA